MQKIKTKPNKNSNLGKNGSSNDTSQLAQGQPLKWKKNEKHL